MITLIKCSSCGQVKKYGEWITISSENLEVLVRETMVEVIKITCERCEERARLRNPSI